MTNLVAAYQANDIREFEKILQLNKCVSMRPGSVAWPGGPGWHGTT